MVHAHAGPRTGTHDLFHPEHRAWNQPDLLRVAGITGCVLVNGVLLMLLMRPADLPMPIFPKPELIVVDLTPKRQPPPAPPPDPEPDIVPITSNPLTPPPVIIRDPQPLPNVPTTDLQTSDPTAVAEDQVFSVPFNTLSNDSTDTTAGPIAEGPIEGVSLQYANAPAPAYTRDLIAQGVEGTVMLKVLVDVDGKPLQVDIHHSSGNRRLDEVARRHVLKTWRFAPAMRNGTAVQAIGIVPIDFRLD